MTTRPATFYADLDRAYRAPPGTCAFILELMQARYRLTREQLDGEIRAIYGHDFCN